MKKLQRPTCKTCFWWEIDEDNRGIKRGFCHNTKVQELGGGSFCETVASCWCDEHPDMWAYKRVLDRQKPQCPTCEHFVQPEFTTNTECVGTCKLVGVRVYSEEDSEACYLHEKRKK